MTLGSVGTGVRKGNVARFPAIGSIVEPVDAEVHVVLSFANRAVFFARAGAFGLVALRAGNRSRHRSPPKENVPEKFARSQQAKPRRVRSGCLRAMRQARTLLH